MRSRWTTCLLVGLLVVGCSEGYAPTGSEPDDAADAGVSPDADASGDPDTGDADTADADDGGDDDAGPDGSDEDPPDGGGEGCTPNHDGVIERDEVTFEAGLHATFEIAEEVEVDTRGDEASDGTRAWDFSGEYEGDTTERIDLEDPDGEWFAGEFPDATYFAPLSISEEELGVFGADQNGLTLQGVVSPEGGFSRTEIEYDPPVEFLQFPMEPGSEWGTDALASGQYGGTTVAGHEDYQSTVDAEGTLDTPFGEFEVLRVRTDMERTSGGWPISSQTTFTFVAECFGAVATVRLAGSEDGEGTATETEEIRRLSQ